MTKKQFWNLIGLWFLIQLVLSSAVGNMNSLQDLQGNFTSKEECESANPVIGFLAGAVMPIASLNITKMDWCWNEK